MKPNSEFSVLEKVADSLEYLGLSEASKKIRIASSNIGEYISILEHISNLEHNIEQTIPKCPKCNQKMEIKYSKGKVIDVQCGCTDKPILMVRK